MTVGRLKMDKSSLTKKILYKIFILLFMIDISFTVRPSGIVQNYGLFGELTSFTAQDYQESSIQSKPIKLVNNKRITTIYNRVQRKSDYLWYLFLMIIMITSYLMSGLILSNGITPVVSKVRMNN